MPPEVAPTQVVIVPIIFKGKEKQVLSSCETLFKNLSKEGLRVHIDDRDITPGNKYYDWELKGVPIRVEIGPKDVEKSEVVIVRRDTSQKKSVSNKSIVITIKKELREIEKKLYEKAKKILDENQHTVKTVEEAKKLKGIVNLPWCGKEDCALEIENILDGKTLGEPIDGKKCSHPCPICGEKSSTWMRYAKTY
jgi:prolyl-tRNA synthetase